MVLAMPLPAPFSTRLWLEFNPGSEPTILSPTSLLQRGHDALIFSHLSTQSLWKKCEHGSSLSSSLFAYFAKQMQQTCTGQNIRSSVIMPITRLETMHREYNKYISNDHDKEHPRIWRQALTASSPEITRSFSVPAATIPPSAAPELLSSPFLFLISLNLCVGKASIDSGVAPLVCVRSSLNPRIEIIQGKQQQIVAHRIKGIAYPIQLNVRNTIHNLQCKRM